MNCSVDAVLFTPYRIQVGITYLLLRATATAKLLAGGLKINRTSLQDGCCRFKAQI